MDNKIYFLGGMIEKYSDDTNDFFYLDVSKPFNLDSTLPIFDLSNDARYIHPHSYGVSSICGPNKDMIFIMCRAFKDSFSYRFINSKEWVPGTGATDIQWLSAVCNENGSRIYIYGSGYDDNEYFMTILYTTSWISVFLDKNNNNIMNYLSLAILLPKGRIVYIGNRYIDNELVNFRNIHIYDTNDGTWINMGTNGTIPSPRNLHTAVLTQDGLIIIYGGIREMRPVPDQILVLDTKVNPFTWSIPNIDPAPSSAPTSGHTATLVGNYMIVAFGNYNHTPQNIVYSDQIHMIDVSEKNNYKWVKSFTPNNTYTIESASTTESASATKSANATKSPGAAHAAIIGGTTCVIATVIIIISVSYLLYRRKRTVIYAPQAKHAINC
ncbi:unnamed protein product [Rhizophagus irregularis]|nr:unnamed protein product [Rhizophagus irregularis]